jgi:hypothetical protein
VENIANTSGEIKSQRRIGIGTSSMGGAESKGRSLMLWAIFFSSVATQLP